MTSKEAGVVARKQAIEIPVPDIQLVTLRLEGITPYLSNAFPQYAIDEMVNKGRRKPEAPKPLPTPEERVHAAIHWFEGKPCVPAAAVHQAIVSAGQRFDKKFGTVLRGMISIRAEWLPIEGAEPKPHFAMARTKGRNATPKPTYRALFDPWSVEAPLSFNAGLISLDQLVNLAVLAGDAVGIGDWRKELSGGTGAFGMFTVSGVDASDSETGR